MDFTDMFTMYFDYCYHLSHIALCCPVYQYPSPSQIVLYLFSSFNNTEVK